MKTCSVCGLDKDPQEYPRNARKADGLQSYCKECNKQKLRAWYKVNRVEHAQKTKRQKAERMRAAKKLVWSLAEECGCINPSCPGPRHNRVVLEFHHVERKEFNISDALNRGVPLKKIMEELKKCVVLCGNCHKRYHAGEIDVDLNKRVFGKVV
jgi:hypothetical protein